MKKKIALLLCVVMLIGSLASCSTLKGSDKGSQVSVYLTGYPESIDPAIYQTNSETLKIFGLVYEGLTIIKNDGTVAGSLAKEWYGQYDKLDEAYKMYFSLNETKWSDGVSVSADDIIFAWKRILDPEFESPFAALLSPIKNALKVKSGELTSDALGVAAVDSTLLEVTFEQEYDIQLFAETVASPGLVALPEDVLSRNEKTWATTSSSMAFNGPFKIVSMERGVKLQLERNPYYRRDLTKDDEDPLDKYVLPHKIICNYSNPDDSTKYTFRQIADRFNNNEIFYIGEFGSDIYSEFESKMKTVSMLNGFAYFFNTTKDIFVKPEVRRALSLALDRNAVVQLLGTGEIAATGFVPSRVFNTKSGTDFRSVGGELYSTSANVSEAKSLLSSAGVTSGSFEIAYDSNDERQKAIAEYAVTAWSELGFTVTAKGYNTVAMSRRMKTDPLYASDTFDVIGLDYSINSTNAFGYLAPFAVDFSGSFVALDSVDLKTPHFTGFNDESYNDLIKSAAYISDRDQLADVLHQAEAKLVELCPATMLYYNVSSYVASSKISEYSTEYFGYMNFDRLELEGYKEINKALEETSALTPTTSAAQ